jgi:endonuclease G, mitochondrial
MGDSTRVNRTATQRPAPIELTADQKVFAGQLLRDFRALPQAKRDLLTRQLQTESPGMWQAIHDGRLALEANRVTTTERQGTPIAISDLPAKLGWEPEGWQMKLIRTLDEPGGQRGIFKTPGRVTVSELLTALRNPDNPQELTTAAYTRLQNVVTQAGANGALISELDTQWKRELAAAANSSGDNRITAEELRKYVDENPAAKNRLALQNLGVMLHQLATVTGEKDPYKMGGLGGGEITFVRNAYSGSYNNQRNVATVVAQVITADDMRQRKSFARDDAFRPDERQAAAQRVTPGDYTNTGFDRGHLASNADAADAQNAFESFLMTNMAPQYPKLNRGAWRFLEDKVRDVVEATGGRAIVYTGTLFLGEDGKPLSPEQLQRIGRNRVAVPSHSFKSILLRMPDGTISTASFMVKNRPDLPIQEAPCGELLRSSRVSIEQLQQLSGINNFFAEFVPKQVEAEVKRSTNAVLAAPASANEEQKAAFQYLFGPAARSTTWRVPPSQYEVDMFLERTRQGIADAKVRR